MPVALEVGEGAAGAVEDRYRVLVRAVGGRRRRQNSVAEIGVGVVRGGAADLAVHVARRAVRVDSAGREARIELIARDHLGGSRGPLQLQRRARPTQLLVGHLDPVRLHRQRLHCRSRRHRRNRCPLVDDHRVVQPQPRTLIRARRGENERVRLGGDRPDQTRPAHAVRHVRRERGIHGREVHHRPRRPGRQGHSEPRSVVIRRLQPASRVAEARVHLGGVRHHPRHQQVGGRVAQVAVHVSAPHCKRRRHASRRKRQPRPVDHRCRGADHRGEHVEWQRSARHDGVGHPQAGLRHHLPHLVCALP
mmetsp:Transcript_37932/g.100917  ORF Transcript_37932/g.100917 Transcript_37932/m.100917 type:complete len:306 (+) Transcript_37932:3615-4532(+)